MLVRRLRAAVSRPLMGTGTARDLHASTAVLGRHHKIAGKKGAADAQRAGMIAKLVNEMIAAAKACNGDLTDLRLSNAMLKAKSLSMPVKNIDSAIKKGTEGKEGTNFETYWLEGIGPGKGTPSPHQIPTTRTANPQMKVSHRSSHAGAVFHDTLTDPARPPARLAHQWG